MSQDLNDLLGDWPYEPGQLKVRKILGSDGQDKIQLRLDMGILQMELSGRPDGQEPFGMESLLDYQEQRAKEAEEAGEEFQLTPDELGELQAEGVQYYHRYIALFQLEEWKLVARDTRRNLDMFSFVGKYAPSDELSWSVQQFRPYVMMMNTRAKANLALEKSDVEAAITLVEKAVDKIRRFYKDMNHEELADDCPEAASLEEWLQELRKDRPLTPIEEMTKEMEQAIRTEKYERAAELRDAIEALKKKA